MQLTTSIKNTIPDKSNMTIAVKNRNGLFLITKNKTVATIMHSHWKGNNGTDE